MTDTADEKTSASRPRLGAKTPIGAPFLHPILSTKYWDADTKTLSYQLRDYSPEMGRWVSRDPICEEGGINIYSFVGNDSMNRFDSIGERWHYFRGGAGAALVWKDSVYDRVETLASMLHLDTPTGIKGSDWLRDMSGMPVSRANPCTLYTVPNTVVVVIGYRTYAEDLYVGGIRHQALTAAEAFNNEGFSVTVLDARNNNVESITKVIDHRTWGLALFGRAVFEIVTPGGGRITLQGSGCVPPAG